MAQDRVLGEQIDVIDLSGDIAADSTAIGNIATGLANDPTAAADLAAGLDHADIGAGIGSNTHLQIDTHILDSTIHFSTITGLSDVNAPSPTDRDVLVWQNGSSTWIPGVRVENPMISDLDTDGFKLITAAVNTAASVKAILLYGGNNDYASGGFVAGGVAIRGGIGQTGNTGGALNIQAGQSNGVTIGANTEIRSGVTSHTSGAGGTLYIIAGDGQAGADGGKLQLEGGFSSHAFGGEILITGGHCGVTTGTGAGDVSILGGTNFNLSGTYAGGDVNIEGGQTTAGGQSGSVNIKPGGIGGNLEGAINFYAATANSGEATINLWSESGNAGYVALKAPVMAAGSPAISRTWILPQDDPTVVAGQVLTTDTNGVLSFSTAPYLPLNITADVTTSYTLVLADGGNMVTMNNAAANDLVIPTNASVAFPIGTEVVVSQFGAGLTTFIGEGSPSIITINSAGGLTSLAEQFSTATLVKVAADTWLLSGDTV